MVRICKLFTPLWSLLFLFFLPSCGKVDTPNVADPFANITGKSLGFDVNPPFFENDASGNQKGLDLAVPGACGNILLQWSVAKDDTSLPNNISYSIYQTNVAGSENFSVPTYQVPAAVIRDQVPSGVIQYLIKNLSPDTTYYFVIRAQDEAGNLSVIDPNHLVERSTITQGTRGSGAGPNLYCPGGYAGETVVLTGTSAGSATTVIFSAAPSPVSVPASATSTTEVRAVIPSNIQSGTVQITPPVGTTSDRFLFFPAGLNISNDSSASTNPAIAVSGTNIGVAWADAYQGKERILFSLSSNGGGTFPSRVVVSDSARFASTPQIAFGSGSNPPIYLVWSDLDAEGNNSEIFFSQSLTNGASFSAPVNLSADAGESLHPRIVSSGSTVSVTWDDNSVLYGLTSVWGSTFNDIYAAAEGGNIYHSTDLGNTWVKQTSGTTGTSNRLNAVWGSSSTDVYAVGTGGTILHSSTLGVTWSKTTATSNTLNAVWGSSSTDVYAVGSGGAILHSNGTTWTAQTSPVGVSLNGIWGSSSTDVYAVGSGGTILHSNGTTWTAQTSPVGVSLNGIWGSGANDIYISGDQGTILYSLGNGTWTAQGTGITSGLNAIWGATFIPSGTTVLQEVIYAGGAGDKIIKKSGSFPLSSSSAWDPTSVVVSGDFNLTSLWGQASPVTVNIYGVQGNGPILQWTGYNWSYLVPERRAGEIFYLQSNDSGATFGPSPIKVSSASPGAQASSPDLIWSGGKLYLIWTESLLGLSLPDPRDQSSIYIAQTPNGIQFNPNGAGQLAASPGLCNSFRFPRLAQTGSAVLAIWQDSYHYYNDPVNSQNSCITYDHSFDQIRLAQFSSLSLPSSFSSQVISPPAVSPLNSAIPMHLGSSLHPTVSAFGQNLAAVWTDTGQGKRELFMVTSPDGGATFTPPGNFSSPFSDPVEESDTPVLVNDGAGRFYMVWEQTVLPFGNILQNSEVFFSLF